VFGQVGISSLKVGTDLGSGAVHSKANLDTLSVNGSVLDGAFVEVDSKLTKLIVGGDIEDGAVIQAGSIGSQNVSGSTDGDIIIK